MQSKITRRGQITIPKSVRTALKLDEGDVVEVELTANRRAIVLRPKNISDLDPEQAYYWSDAWQAQERSADRDIRAGRIRKLNNPDDLDK
jgi:AbrB family looped-hinge helix DNA binding protein